MDQTEVAAHLVMHSEQQETGAGLTVLRQGGETVEASSSAVVESHSDALGVSSLVTQSIGESSRDDLAVAIGAAGPLSTRKAIPVFTPLDDGYAVVCLVTNEEKEVLRRCWTGSAPTATSAGAADEGRMSLSRQQPQPTGQQSTDSSSTLGAAHSQAVKSSTSMLTAPQPVVAQQTPTVAIVSTAKVTPVSAPPSTRPPVAAPVVVAAPPSATGKGFQTPARAPMPILVPKQGLPPGFPMPGGVPQQAPAAPATNRHAAELGATPQPSTTNESSRGDARQRSSTGSRTSGTPSTRAHQQPPVRHPLPAEPLPILIPLGVAEKAGSDPVFARLLVERARMSACKDRRIRPAGRPDTGMPPLPETPANPFQQQSSQASLPPALVLPGTPASSIAKPNGHSTPAPQPVVSQGPPASTVARPVTQASPTATLTSLPPPGARLVTGPAPPQPQPSKVDPSVALTPATPAPLPATPQAQIAPASAAMPVERTASGISTAMGLPPPGARLHTTSAPVAVLPTPKPSAPVTQILQRARPATTAAPVPGKALPPPPGTTIYPPGVKHPLIAPAAVPVTLRPAALGGVGGPVARTQAQPDQARPFNPAAQLTRAFVQSSSAQPPRRVLAPAGHQWVPPQRVLSAPTPSQSYHNNRADQGGQFQANSMNYRDRRKRTRSITPDHQRPQHTQRQPQAGQRRFNAHDPVAMSLKKDVPKGYVIVFDTSLLLDLSCSELTALVFDNKLVFPYKVVQELDDHHHNRGRPEIRQQALMVRDWLYEALDTHLVDEHIRLQGRDEIPAIHEKTASSSDDHILGCAAFFAQRYKGKIPVILATRDKFMAIKAKGERGLALRVVGYHELLQWIEPKDEKKSKRDDK